jgi:RNA polymerase sigma-70 factor, ECF subfamily
MFVVDKSKKIDPQEHSLIERCKKGEFPAFRELMERYQSRIYSVCYGIMRNREDALDVVQDVFIKIYKSIDQFKGESGLYVWMYRIAVNKSLDLYRKKKRKAMIYEKASNDARTFNTQFEKQTPQEETLAIELKEKVAEAIAQLPEKQKGIIILREIEGLSYQEISRIMYCSVGTVMSRLFYARKKLAKYLTKYVHKKGIPGEER